MCLVVVLTKPYYASWSLLMNVGALCWHDMLASGLNCTLTQWFWNTSSIPMHFITLWKIQLCFHKRCNACAVYVCIILFVFEIYVADFTTKWFARLSSNMLMHRLGPHSALQQIVICRASVTNVTTICFLAENCVFAAYSEWYASGKNIVWQLFQAIQSIQIAVEFTSGKTRCVLKSVRPLEFDSCCMWRQRSISQTILWPRHWLSTYSESIVRVHVESRKCPWSGWPCVFGSLICNLKKQLPVTSEGSSGPGIGWSSDGRDVIAREDIVRDCARFFACSCGRFALAQEKEVGGCIERHKGFQRGFGR